MQFKLLLLIGSLSFEEEESEREFSSSELREESMFARRHFQKRTNPADLKQQVV